MGANSNSLRFKLKDLDGVSANLDKFVKDFKVVVNFRPEKEIKSLPLKCKNADLSLLFGTKDELINNKDMMGTLNVAGGGGGDDDKKSSPAVTPIFEDHPKAPPRYEFFFFCIVHFSVIRDLTVLKSVFSEIRVRTRFLVVSRQKTGLFFGEKPLEFIS